MIYSDALHGCDAFIFTHPTIIVLSFLTPHTRKLTYPLFTRCLASPPPHPHCLSVHLHLHLSTPQPKGGPRLPFEQATMGVTGGVKGLFKALETELPK